MLIDCGCRSLNWHWILAGKVVHCVAEITLTFSLQLLISVRLCREKYCRAQLCVWSTVATMLQFWMIMMIIIITTIKYHYLRSFELFSSLLLSWQPSSLFWLCRYDALSVDRVTAKDRSLWALRCQRSSTGSESLSSGHLTSTSSPTSVTKTAAPSSGTLLRIKFFCQ